MRSFFAFLLSLATISLFGQNQELKSFNAVDIFGPFKVELIHSDKQSVELESINIDMNDIIVEVKRGELRLKIKSRHYWSDWDSNHRKRSQYVKAKIYYKSLNELEASAGANVEAKEAVRSNKFLVTGSMGAEINMAIETNVVYVKSSMGGVVNINGKASYVEVLGKMGGEVNASQLECKSAYVSASMGSNVSIYASEEVDIAANFGADVKYSGNPTIRHTNKKMGAEIRKR